MYAFIPIMTNFRTSVILDPVATKIYQNQPKSFNLSKFVRDMLVDDPYQLFYKILEEIEKKLEECVCSNDVVEIVYPYLKTKMTEIHAKI